jgi:hypothetical protein
MKNLCDLKESLTRDFRLQVFQESLNGKYSQYFFKVIQQKITIYVTDTLDFLFLRKSSVWLSNSQVPFFNLF